MFQERLYDRAVELYDAGTPKGETLAKLSEIREDFTEEDRNFLLDAGYSRESVEQEVQNFNKRMEAYSKEIVDELYR